MSHDPLENQGLGITSPMFLGTYMGTYDPRVLEEGDSRIMQMYLDHQYKVALNLNNEIKWVKVTENYLQKYMEMMDVFFSFIGQGKVKVRIMFRPL